jgi:hypothetical protein
MMIQKKKKKKKQMVICLQMWTLCKKHWASLLEALSLGMGLPEGDAFLIECH